MNKQELIERIEGLKNIFGNKVEYIEIDAAIELVSKLDEPQPVKVPQIVADWYEDVVDEFYIVLERLVLNYRNNTNMPICKWFLETEDALKILINMHQFGYEVEKEKRYLVKVKGIVNALSFLSYHKKADIWTVTDINNSNDHRTHHTRKELEEAGFSEIFNSPLFETVEVD